MNLSRFPAVLPTDLNRIEAAFRDLSQNTGEPASLSFASFKRDVFANFLPEKLAVVCGQRFLSARLVHRVVCILSSVSIIYSPVHRDRACPKKNLSVALA